MTPEKKQWVAPAMTDLELDSTLGGGILNIREDAEYHT